MSAATKPQSNITGAQARTFPATAPAVAAAKAKRDALLASGAKISRSARSQRIREMPPGIEDPFRPGREIADALGIGLSTLWAGVATGRFPRPVYVTPRSPRWCLSWFMPAPEAALAEIASAAPAPKARAATAKAPKAAASTKAATTHT
jgi:hypothetical protein